jgi:hypothetical protein
LNADLFRVNLANGQGCICGCAFEAAVHFILERCICNEDREELKLRLVFLRELTIEALHFGDDTLTDMHNLQMSKICAPVPQTNKTFYPLMIITLPPLSQF